MTTTTVPKILIKLVKDSDEVYKNTKLETYLQTELDNQVPNQNNWDDAKDEFGAYLINRDIEYKTLKTNYKYSCIANIVVGSILGLSVGIQLLRKFTHAKS